MRDEAQDKLYIFHALALNLPFGRREKRSAVCEVTYSLPPFATINRIPDLLGR
jgi:hypothetical protein